MKLFVIICVVGLFCTGYSVQFQNSGKLKVSLYYEALCPYCAHFIVDQLYPDYQKIGSYLVLDLVPYGNARRSKHNGTWHFECQHGPSECALNKLEACGLAKSRSQEHDIKFVNCIESSPVVNLDIQGLADRCGPTLGLTGDVLVKCVNGTEGSAILAHLGELTDAVTPPIDGVPTICFNNQNIDNLDEDARKDFLGTACRLLDNKPKGCPGSNDIYLNAFY